MAKEEVVVFWSGKPNWFRFQSLKVAQESRWMWFIQPKWYLLNKIEINKLISNQIIDQYDGVIIETKQMTETKRKKYISENLAVRSVEKRTEKKIWKSNWMWRSKWNQWPKKTTSVHITLAWRISIKSASTSLSLRTINSHIQFDRFGWMITTKNDLTTRKCIWFDGREMHADHECVLVCATISFYEPGGKFSHNSDFLIQIPIWVCSQINSLFAGTAPAPDLHSTAHWHNTLYICIWSVVYTMESGRTYVNSLLQWPLTLLGNRSGIFCKYFVSHLYQKPFSIWNFRQIHQHW